MNYMSGEDLPDCDRELWERGKHIATIFDLKSEVIERIVRFASRLSGQRVDWHYVGGNAAVRALGDLDSIRTYLQEGLRQYEGKYRFTTDNDGVLPFPFR